LSDLLNCAQLKRRTGDDRVRCGFHQSRCQLGKMLSIGLEAFGNHYKILAFTKAVALEFVEECNRMGCLTW
jgi:hypothetical protein